MAQSSSELLGHLQETSEGDLMELARGKWQWSFWCLWGQELELHSNSGLVACHEYLEPDGIEIWEVWKPGQGFAWWFL